MVEKNLISGMPEVQTLLATLTNPPKMQALLTLILL